MRRIFLLLAGTVLTHPALALDQCTPSPADKQVRICVYNPTQRYLVNGVVGFPVNLSFGPGETIKRTEFAYTGVDKDGAPVQTWRGPEQKPEKNAEGQAVAVNRFHNNLPAWALYRGHSALFVVTTLPGPDSAERTYLFDLVARTAADCEKDKTGAGCSDDATTTTALTFTYPLDEAAAKAKAEADKKAAAAVAWQARQKTEKEETAVARLKQDVVYGGERNWKYQAKGEEKWRELAPSKVSDNGWLTVFEWPQNVQIPAITIIDPVTKEERLANYSQQGHMLIATTTSEWWRLRIGKDAVMDLHNLAWHPERPNPETGTTSPDAVRVVLYKDGKPQ
jgi:type IV secretory pathway VirB9-like protein